MNIFLNEYFGFCFELNFELNHFLARFNEKMNFQNVSHTPMVHMGNLTTRGEVRVEVEVVKDTSTITLHANSKFVKIAHDKVVVQEVENSSNIIPLKDYKEDGEKEFYTLTLDSQVKRGQGLLLTVPFVGVIRDGRRNGAVLVDSTDTRGDRNEQFGFYVSTDGDWGIMALTRFVSFGARKAFPCFDEPKLKARFSLSLARPRQYSSLGNMPQKQVGAVMEEDHNYRWDHYKKSPKMSTYLVKWVVSTFNYVEANTTRGVRVRALLRRKRKQVHVTRGREFSQDTRPSREGLQDGVPAAQDRLGRRSIFSLPSHGRLGSY